MRVALFFFFALIANFSYTQSLDSDGRTVFYVPIDESYQIDSSYHLRFKTDGWGFYDKDSNQIFQEFFDEYPMHLGASNFKMKNKKGNFIVNPKTKKILLIDPKYKARYDFNDIRLAISSISMDTLIKLKTDFINFKNEMIVNSEVFSPQKNYKKEGKPFIKGYMIKDEIDLFFEDEGYFDQMDTSEYDDGIRDYIFIQKNKTPFFKTEIYSEAYELDEVFSVEVKTPFEIFYERCFIAKKNGKFGVVSTLGKEILPFEFSDINPIIQEQLVLFNHPILFMAKKNNLDEIYDSKGKFLFSSNYIPQSEYIEMELYGNFNYGYYEGLPLKNKNKNGIISLNGREIIPAKYDYVDIYNFDLSEVIKAANMNKSSSCQKYEYEQYFMGINESNQNYSYDFYAPNGKFLNHFEIDAFEEYNNRGYISYYKGDYYGLIGPGACSVLDAKYQNISVFMGARDIFSVQEDSLSYFVNGKGEKLFKGEVSGTFVDGIYAVVYQNGAYGLMDVEKSIDTISWTIQAKYDDINKLNTYNNQPIFIVKKNNKFGLVNAFDKEVLPIVYEQISMIGELILTLKNGKYGLDNFYNSVSQTVLMNEYDKIDPIKYNLFRIQKGNKVALYHQYDRKFVCDFDFESIENISSNNYSLFVKKNGKMGVISEKGKMEVEAIYKAIKFDSVSNEYECLKENGQKDCFFVK